MAKQESISGWIHYRRNIDLVAPIDAKDVVIIAYVGNLVAGIPVERKAKFFCTLHHPNFVNRRMKLVLSYLFAACETRTLYKLRMTASSWLINASQVNLSFQRRDSGQQHGSLQEIFKGAEGSL